MMTFLKNVIVGTGIVLLATVIVSVIVTYGPIGIIGIIWTLVALAVNPFLLVLTGSCITMMTAFTTMDITVAAPFAMSWPWFGAFYAICGLVLWITWLGTME